MIRQLVLNCIASEDTFRHRIAIKTDRSARLLILINGEISMSSDYAL